MPTIETQRLNLRPITTDDLAALAWLWSLPETTRYLPTGEPRSLQATQVELDYMVQHRQTHGFGVWAVRLKGMDNFIGYCGIQYLHAEPCGVTAEALAGGTDVEVVVGLDPAYWGRGLAAEATLAALQYGFDTARLPRIVAAIHPDNEASRHILQGRMRMRAAGDLHYYGDCPHFVLTREEFRAQQGSSGRI